MLDYIWGLFLVCLVVGIAFLIRGLYFFSDPFAAKKSFFIAGLSYLAPVIIALVLFITEGNFDNIPSGFSFILIILSLFLFLSRFGISEDFAARNTTLIFSILLLVQLLLLMWFLSMIFGIMEPPEPSLVP